MTQFEQADCIVVGAGPVGLAAAAALAARKLEVVLVGTLPQIESTPAASSGDPRTAALIPCSLAVLDALGALPRVGTDSEPIAAIRIIDVTGRLLRAPEVTFTAADAQVPWLAHNVPHGPLLAGLLASAHSHGVRLIDGGHVEHLDGSGDSAEVRLADGRIIAARLVIAADGRNSACRAASGIGIRRRDYPQSAIATRFRHSRPHHGISNELHGVAGPCTTVPLPGLASSLVWVERPHTADELMALPADEFLARLEHKLDSLLGSLSSLGHRASFRLAGFVADRLGASRVALVGEAGHVVPPIGAQGLNLGLADVAVLADIVGGARDAGEDIGCARVLAAYHTARAPDIARRAGAVDAVNRMLISGLVPLSLARGAGLHAIAASSSMRRQLMRAGLAAPAPTPSLMRSAVLV